LRRKDCLGPVTRAKKKKKKKPAIRSSPLPQWGRAAGRYMSAERERERERERVRGRSEREREK